MTTGRSAASRSRPTTPMCRRTTRRSPQKSPATSPAFRSPTTPTFTPATLSRPSTMATTGSPSTRRARRSRPRTATIARMGHQIAAQEAAVQQAKTQLVSAQAAARRTELELNRQNLLVARDASSRQLQEQAQANRDQAVAGVQGAQAAIDSAAANVDVLKGQQQEAIPTLNELKTALAKAERDLSFTVIRAPLDGVIGNRAVQTGDYVQTGQRLASLVPLAEVYVTANFKETQLAQLQARTTGLDRSRCASRTPHPRYGRKLLAGFGRRVLAAAAGQRHRKLHQDRAAAAGANPCPGRSRQRRIAAARHVGRGEREHQAERVCRQSARPARLRARRHADRREARHMATAAAIASPGQAGIRTGRCRARRSASRPRLSGDVLRHVHGVSRHPGGVGVAVGNPGRACRFQRRDHLGADVVPDGRSGRDSTLRLPLARARHARHVCHRRRGLHRRQPDVRAVVVDGPDDRLARDPGFHRRRHGADGLRLRLFHFPAPACSRSLRR